MTSAQIWYEPTILLERCNLSEALLWVWYKRLPKAELDGYGVCDFNVFEIMSDEEYQHIGISRTPCFELSRGLHLCTSGYLKRSSSYDTSDEAGRVTLLKEALAETRVVKRWVRRLEVAAERSATKLYLALAENQLSARGMLLPEGADILDLIGNHPNFTERPLLFDRLQKCEVPSDVWSRDGIDWLSSAVSRNDRHYCHVSVDVDDLMRVFSSEGTPVKAAFVGNGLVATLDGTPSEIESRQAKVGRPTVYSWNMFHVKVAALIAQGKMPYKKESAIREMQAWFESIDQTPCRSAISEKLTPYYTSTEIAPFFRQFKSDRNSRQ
jgi:hypothetical protein